MVICFQENKNLVEELGLFFQEYHKFPPLASRLYVIMILSSSDGFTFEELMKLTQSSKSSVSTNLNLLVSLKFVDFYTKPGKRKRYFKTTGSYVKNMLNEHVEAITTELKMVEKINAFNSICNPLKFEQKGYVGTIFQSYLVSAKKNTEETLEKIASFPNND